MADKFTIEERIGNEVDLYKKIINKIKFEMRCAAPAIVKSFDEEKQTVSVQIVTKERVFNNGEYQIKKIPIIEQVPIYMVRAGGFVVTVPVKEGDECLLIFADTCIDAWFQNGGEENQQIFQRRHDLSDCFALCGPWNQNRVIRNYCLDGIELRTDDGSTSLKIKDGEVVIKSESIKLGDVEGLRKLIDERFIELYAAHTHPYNPGPGSPIQTGVPTVPVVLENVATQKTEAL